MFPEYALIDGKEIKINTDYRTAIACLKAIEDDEIDDVTRALVVISLLFGEETEIINYEEALKKATYFLCCGKKQTGNNEQKLMDYEADSDYIYASFRNEYHIDLNKIENMHWWEYNSLITGLSEQSILAKIIGIREMNVADYKDAKTKAKIMKAKEKVKLPQKEMKFNKDEMELLESLGINYRRNEV